MPYRTDIVYRYDGTLDGFLCCVAYESYASREMPAAILGPDDAQLSLLETREIATDPSRRAGASNRSRPASARTPCTWSSAPC